MNAVEKTNMTEQKSVNKSLNKKKSKNKKNHQQNQQQLEKLNETVKQSLPPVKIKISSEKNVYELGSIDKKTITTAINGDAVNGDLNELASPAHINENGCIDTSKSDKNLSSSSLSNESGIINGKASTSSSPQQNQSSKGHIKKNNANMKSSSSSSLSVQSHSSEKVLDLQNDQQKINKQKSGKNELPSSHMENHENINNRLTKKNNKKSKNKSAAALTTETTTIVIENSQNDVNDSKNKHNKSSNTNKSTKKPRSKLYTVSNSGELLSSINLEVNDDDDDDDEENGDNNDDDIENHKNSLENKLESVVDDKKTKNKNITNILSLSSSSSSNQCCKKTASSKKIDCSLDNNCHDNSQKIGNENADNLEETKKIEHQNDNNNSDNSSCKNNNNDNNENVIINSISNHSNIDDDNKLNSNSSNSNTNSTVINDSSCCTSNIKDEKLNLPNYIEPCSSSSLSKTNIDEASNLVTNDDSLSPSSDIDRSNIVIEYKEYESELQMQDIMRLIQTELSEPYSIYTYRYFIYNWPKLCFLAAHGDEYVGAIVCKLDMHMNVKRGYIAMLAVKKEYRKLRIGTNLVQKAIEAMLADNADEVVLETEMKNIPALRLYENLGFVRDKRLFRYYLNGVDALRLKLWFR